MQRKRTLCAAAALSVAACITMWQSGVLVGPAKAQTSVPSYIRAAIDAPGRPPTDRVRDAVLKPAEVIMFAGIKQGDVVVDLNPGNMYWTRILSKVVGPKGRVYALVQRGGGNLVLPPPDGGNPAIIGAPPPQGGGGGGAAGNGPPPPPPTDANGGGRGDDVATALALMNTTDYKNVTALIENQYQFAVPEQADFVWAADYHQLHFKKYGAPMNVLPFNQVVFRAMNSGGRYIIIDNASAPNDSINFDKAESLHRINKQYLRAQVLPAMFVTEADSNLLADASDDHTSVVADGGADKADRLLMKFRKPTNAPNSVAAHDRNRMKNYWNAGFVLGGVPTGGIGQAGGNIWNNQDGTYIEIGRNGPNAPTPYRIQRGEWFFDADGNYCILFNYPLTQRQSTGCHPFIAEINPGEKWIEYNGGRGGNEELFPGHSFPITPGAEARIDPK